MANLVNMPKLGFDMAEGTLIRWDKKVGDSITRGEVLAEIETDKATVEVQSTFDGVLAKLLVEEGQAVPVGDPIAWIAEPGEDVSALEVPVSGSSAPGEAVKETVSSPETQPQLQSKQSSVITSGRVKVSPLARKIASERGISLQGVQGSGPGGRIVKRDLETLLDNLLSQDTKKEIRPLPSPNPLVDRSAIPADEVVKASRLRQAINRRMTSSKQQIPHFYVAHEYDFAPIMKLRSELNALLPEDQKISVNDFIIKAAAMALRFYPNLNASMQDDEIVRHGHVNIGVAVAVEGGLLTVVSKDADVKPLRLISSEVREMAAKAREGKVRPEEIEGSTFSISNLGMFDVDEFSAIINPPEAAILAVGSVKQTPVVVNGELQVGTRLKATLSGDHRITDGAEAAQFLQCMEDFLEQPMRLLL
jgi:pyruvate dehydrogenase E2 component (dihydrolipoamide acetyltransferase)